MKKVNDILCMFDNVPQVAIWASDKTSVITEIPTSDFPYKSIKYVFSGEFKNSKTLSNSLQQIENDGDEFMISVSVTKPRYKGQKAHVSVMISHYAAA